MSVSDFSGPKNLSKRSDILFLIDGSECLEKQNIRQESSPLGTPDLVRPSGRVSWRVNSEIQEIPNKKSNRKLSGKGGS